MIKASKKHGFEPDYAVPPGETLKEVIDSMAMTQKDLSERTGLTVQSINRIIKGDQPITYETANALELVTGVSARMWNTLEANYREQLEKIQERERLEKDVDWLKTIPVKELIKRGYISDIKDNALQLREVLKFFEVSSVAGWGRLWDQPKVAARRSACFESMPGYASTWIRMGEIEAGKIDCKPYDKKIFESALVEIKKLTVLDPQESIPKMRQLCADSGVALSLIPEMPKVPWNGATKWLNPNKVMILLSLRGKGEDIFWFSFFHEAAHVLHDNRKDLYINDNAKEDPKELAADKFASNFLIPEKYKTALLNIKSQQEIALLAEKLGVCPGIVAGQYRFMTKKWSWFNNVIRSFCWGT